MGPGRSQHGLANVYVWVVSEPGWPVPQALGTTWTAADGSYTVKGLPARANYRVCSRTYYWAPPDGGSSDATGYAPQCFDNLPSSGMPTPVTVTSGANTPGIDAALVAGGAISGRVTDAGGTQHGPANLMVAVSSVSTGTSTNASTSADGSYTVTGLAAGTDPA